MVGGSEGSNLTGLLRKFFKKCGSADQKALTEDTANSRTLAMALQSERELMDRKLKYEAKISELRSEVEKLTDLYLKQRKEIKELKFVILFPDERNSQVKVMQCLREDLTEEYSSPEPLSTQQHDPSDGSLFEDLNPCLPPSFS